MARATIKNKKQLIDGIVKGYQEIAQDVFDQSQADCPVLSGDLKATGKLKLTRDGAVIKYGSSICSASRAVVGNFRHQRTLGYHRPFCCNIHRHATDCRLFHS